MDGNWLLHEAVGNEQRYCEYFCVGVTHVVSLQVVPRKLGVLRLHVCDFKDNAKLFFKEISGLSKSISWLIFICLLIMKIGQNHCMCL